MSWKRQILKRAFTALILLLISPGSANAFHSHDNSNAIDDNSIKSADIDFSDAIPEGPDGALCVQRRKFVDKLEKNQLKECFVQNVTQCYYTYVTEYSDADEEKCDEFYWKNCKIVFEERAFNLSTRICKRPLVKRCDQDQQLQQYGSSGLNSDPKMICENLFETECNTTDIVPDPGDEPLTVTFCYKIPRRICAPDNCRIVEGPETCQEDFADTIMKVPTELCDLQPQKHCTVVKVAVPRLVPERKCRQIEKQICNTRFINPHVVEKTIFIKYCSRPDTTTTTTNTFQPPRPDDLPLPVYSVQEGSLRNRPTNSYASQRPSVSPGNQRNVISQLGPRGTFNPSGYGAPGNRVKRRNDIDIDTLQGPDQDISRSGLALSDDEQIQDPHKLEKWNPVK